MRKPTMQRIADQLGISKNSVSLALTGRAGVSKELREKVLEAALEIGYPIEKLKTKTSMKSAHMIGLIAREEIFAENTFFGVINLHIEKEIKSREGHLLLHAVEKESEEKLKLPSFLTEKKVDGLLVLSHLRKEFIQAIIQSGIPVVLVDHHDPNLNVDFVLTDNRKGAYLATIHLIRKGARSVGFIGEISKSPSYRERFEGFLDAMQEEGLSIEDQWVNHHINEQESLLYSYLKSLPSLPDAWFCANDHFGFLITRNLNKLGIRVPEDCSVCGFDDSIFATLSMPKLTTIAINKENFAIRSVVQLYRRMENLEMPFEKTILNVELIERETIFSP
ncbi:LacI family DNA-binding transcriptional regulator [Paenibacillus sp. KQZ6P-2]|uniref:LacI family DNA-binding transcriptional regulator n=1 Tax=Paenibacillus mangrovi TaxID=2931978 RepID=A0A9X2B734_9BACL|nr:LacI family DNA-binding transcriptional regulator [Paenibacillus mangrovi]MCJ8014507.1 LacI family DNA-binding transcriptional regulator [Paenibacillus mangrovi]